MCEFDPRCSGSDDLIGHALAQIARGSWAVTGVYGDGDYPPIAYTSGLTELGRPELVITGVDPEPASRLLNEAASRVISSPTFAAGDDLAGLPSATIAAFATLAVIDLSALRVTRMLFGHGFQAVQLVWPDRRGRLPWERGYSLHPDSQPLLGITTAAA